MGDPTLKEVLGAAILILVGLSVVKSYRNAQKVCRLETERAITELISNQLSAIPTVGPSGIFSAVQGAWNSLWYTRAMLEEGYNKVRNLGSCAFRCANAALTAQYYGRAFKIAQMNRWLVIISSAEMIQEFSQAPDDQLSITQAVEEVRFCSVSLYDTNPNTYLVSSNFTLLSFSSLRACRRILRLNP
jgi:hypothetical protein